MTTPPPPPPGSDDWPSSQPSEPPPPRQPVPPAQPSQPVQPDQPWPPSQPTATGDGGRQKWWTGGRVLAAIAIVLVLMTGSAVVGFLAGSTWGTFDTFADGFDFDGDGLPFDDEVPGFVPVDAPAAEGDVLRSGSEVSDVVEDQAVAHALTVESTREVELEITEADFDTVLVVLDSSGEVVEADDDGGDDTNSALRLSLEAGTYQVRVQPWGSGAGGSYTLAVD